MDEVSLTRGQLRELAEKDQDVTIEAVNTDAKMILVVPTKYRGTASKTKWMKSDGKFRKEAQ